LCISCSAFQKTQREPVASTSNLKTQAEEEFASGGSTDSSNDDVWGSTARKIAENDNRYANIQHEVTREGVMAALVDEPKMQDHSSEDSAAAVKSHEEGHRVESKVDFSNESTCPFSRRHLRLTNAQHCNKYVVFYSFNRGKRGQKRESKRVRKRWITFFKRFQA